MAGRRPLRPLRNIVRHKHDQYGDLVEVLECGHEQRPRRDIAGETNAVRRRCRRCPPAEAGAAQQEGGEER